LNNPELATRLAENAFAEIGRYNWNSVRDQWLNVYLDLMPSRGKSEEVSARLV